MKKSAIFAVVVFLASASALHAAINESCKAGSDGTSTLRVHGRLGVYNGGYPNLRLWNIGTRHMFGIYSDPADLRCARGLAPCDSDEDTKLPGNIDRSDFIEFEVYGDFELRLLEPFRPGHRQAACIIRAEHVVRAQTR